MTDTRGAAAEPASTRARASERGVVDSRPRISAAFASALAGAALIVGSVITVVIVVAATAR